MWTAKWITVNVIDSASIWSREEVCRPCWCSEKSLQGNWHPWGVQGNMCYFTQRWPKNSQTLNLNCFSSGVIHNFFLGNSLYYKQHHFSNRSKFSQKFSQFSRLGQRKKFKKKKKTVGVKMCSSEKTKIKTVWSVRPRQNIDLSWDFN